jgi:hypothetical protein
MPVMIRDGSKPRLDLNNQFLTYLDHDHRERENVRFFAICPLLVQDLWRNPSRGMTVVSRGASHGIQVLSDRSKTKIRDPCVAGGIHKDIWLDACQCGGKTGFRIITHSLEITMNYVARVEKVKAFSDIR